MALTPTNKFVNFSTVTFTPTGGSPSTITGVKSISLAANAQVLKESGDADLFNTFAGVVALDWVVTIDVNKAAVLNSVTPGAVGILVYTINDARNAASAGGGALTYTISNAVYVPQTLSAQHRQMATNQYQFDTYGSDGSTSPVAVASV